MCYKTVVVGAKITVSTRMLIQKFLEKDMHVSVSDFVRDAIREKIQRDAPQLYTDLFQENPTE